MAGLDGTWEVERVSGLLPPLLGVRKRIRGARGETSVGRLPGVPFDVVGYELRYRAPLDGFVDVLEPAEGGFAGRALLNGREYARFRLRPERSPVATTEDELAQHLDEAVAMEENSKRMLDSLIATTDDAGVIDLLEHHKAETETHSRRMRDRLQTLGKNPSVVREATGILGALARLPLDIARGEKAGRNARDGYTMEHLEIAAYELLVRVAERAGDAETVAAARQNLQEERAFVARLEQHWDVFAQRPMREEGITA